MSNPGRADIHIDVALTDISIAYMNDEANYVNEKIFPTIGVQKQSNKYFVYDKGDSLRIHTQIRNAGAESAGAGYDLSTDNYFCDPFALHTEVNDQDEANADDPLDLERDATELVTKDIMMKKENDFFAKYFTTGLWSVDAVGQASSPTGNQFLQWDLAGSTPIEDIERYVELIISQTGVNPLDITLTYSPDTWSIIKNHPDILDRIKYTQKGIVTADLVAEVMGIKQVLIGRGVVNTAAKGQTAVVGYMAPVKTALLTYAPSSPSMKRPSAGYTFNWTGYNKGEAVKVFKWYIETRRANRIEVENAWDQKLVAADCGIFLSVTLS